MSTRSSNPVTREPLVSSSSSGAPSSMDPALAANMHAYWRGYDRRGAAPVVDGLVTYSFGVPDVQLNGVLHADLEPVSVAAAVEAVVAGFDAVDLPGVWWVGPDSTPSDLSVRLQGLGLPEVAATTLMTVDLERVRTPLAAPELVVGPVPPDEVAAWASVIATCFGLAPVAVAPYVALESSRPATDDYLRIGGWRDGQLVATSALTIDRGVAGVYTVATLPDHQRRGYGGAVTAAALVEGRRRGMRVGTLQATAAGRPVYQRMGFADLATFRLHALPAS
ncbi:MAG: GNAT family N-acetyltransferase [Phycicoccus sp.]